MLVSRLSGIRPTLVVYVFLCAPKDIFQNINRNSFAITVSRLKRFRLSSGITLNETSTSSISISNDTTTDSNGNSSSIMSVHHLNSTIDDDYSSSSVTPFNASAVDIEIDNGRYSDTEASDDDDGG